MPTIKLNKFSRSKVDESAAPKPRGRPSKKLESIQEVSPESEPVISESYNYDILEPQEQEEPVYDDDFLKDLNNENYKEPEKEVKEPKQPKQPKQPKIPTLLMEDNDSLFDEVGTEIVGKDRRELVARLNQYKSLFPEELKSFKVKKKATIAELKSYLEEAESIVDTSSVENFMTDSILQCIRIAEGVSSYSKKYDVQGCADLLKSNKQFHSLCKQCYVKYKIFSAVPPEMQLIMLVATTAYICNHKNRNKESIESYLNQPIV